MTATLGSNLNVGDYILILDGAITGSPVVAEEIRSLKPFGDAARRAMTNMRNGVIISNTAFYIRVNTLNV